ncbi:MAG: hypothetical protein H7329_19035 [Opitutaceae bacterium]|nr:hypothetical protein [Cytophagales bacterium]
MNHPFHRTTGAKVITAKLEYKDIWKELFNKNGLGFFPLLVLAIEKYKKGRS